MLFKFILYLTGVRVCVCGGGGGEGGEQIKLRQECVKMSVNSDLLFHPILEFLD